VDQEVPEDLVVTEDQAVTKVAPPVVKPVDVRQCAIEEFYELRKFFLFR
jgi:hypothetical protein